MTWAGEQSEREVCMPWLDRQAREAPLVVPALAMTAKQLREKIARESRRAMALAEHMNKERQR